MTTQIYLHFTSVCCKNWVGAIARSHVNESWKYNWKSQLPKSFYPLNFFCAHPQASGFCLQSSTLRTLSAGYKLETPENEIQNTLPCGCTNLSVKLHLILLLFETDAEDVNFLTAARPLICVCEDIFNVWKPIAFLIITISLKLSPSS